MEQENNNRILLFWQQHKTILYFSIALLLVGILLTIIIRAFLLGGRNSSQNPQISPVPFKFGRESNNNIELSPLQKTEIGKTTDEEVTNKNKIISKSEENGITTYKVESKIPLTPDEIRTQNGVVTFERTSTKTDSVAPLQNLVDYESLFGKPELVVNRVGPLGWENSAYLYPTKGFILYANRYTKSVYEVQRFKPMSVEDYQKIYGDEFLSPAPSPAAEGFQ